MNLDVILEVFFELLGINLPAMIALIIGMVVTLAHWRRHPPAARWAMLGFVWMFVTYLLAIAWHSYLVHVVVPGPRQFEDEAPYLMGLSCLEALGFGFFMLALNAAAHAVSAEPLFRRFCRRRFSAPPLSLAVVAEYAERIRNAKTFPFHFVASRRRHLLCICTRSHQRSSARSRSTITSRKRTCSASPIRQNTSRMSRGAWRESTDDRKTDMWVVPTAGGPSRRLTADRASDRAPQWNPDGTLLYFLGNRKREGEKKPPYDGKTQVWRITRRQGKPEAVTRVEGGIRDTNYARRRLPLLPRPRRQDEVTAGCAASYKLEYGHGQNRQGRIWKLDLNRSEPKRSSTPGATSASLPVAPNGKKIAMISPLMTRSSASKGNRAWNLGEASEAAPSRIRVSREHAVALCVAGKNRMESEGDKLAFGVIFDGYPAEIVIADNTGNAFPLLRPKGAHVRGYGSSAMGCGKG